MASIAGSHHPCVDVAGGRGSLDDRAWDNLDMDAVFAAIDRTESTVGQQRLYHRLRSARSPRSRRLRIARGTDGVAAGAARAGTDGARPSSGPLGLRACVARPAGVPAGAALACRVSGDHGLDDGGGSMLAAMWPRLLLAVPVITVTNLLLRIATAAHVGRALIGCSGRSRPWSARGSRWRQSTMRRAGRSLAPLCEDVPVAPAAPAVCAVGHPAIGRPPPPVVSAACCSST